VLNPLYVTGFSDGEACFHLAIGKNAKYKIGYYVNPGFSIALNRRDLELLKKIQDFFGGIGVISKLKKDMVQFRVFSIKELEIIINHFDQYPLISKKRADFLLFKEAFRLIQNKEHLTIEGFNKIISIRGSMNKGLPETLKINFTNIITNKVPIVTLPDNLDPNWIVGFMEAEGCFFVKTSKNKINKTQIVIGCQLTQHSRDLLLIEKLSSFFNCGRTELVRSKYSNFVVTKFSDIIKIIIPFFEKYPILGDKSKDFKNFKLIAKLMTSKAHLTPKGVIKILKIKSKMNSSK